MLKNFATFQSALPEDPEEFEKGELVPPGCNLVKAIAAHIPSAKTPFQHSFYGWKFEFKTASGRDAWTLIQSSGPWLMIVEAKCGWLEGGSRKARAHEEAVDVMKAALSALPEVSEVLWQTQEEFSAGQRNKSKTC